MWIGFSLRELGRGKSLSLGMLVAMACHILAGVAVYADQVKLKDGRTLAADEVWEVGDDLWYRKGKVMNSLRKDAVARVLRGTDEEVQAQLAAEAAAEAARLKAHQPVYVGIPGTLTAVKKDAVKQAETKRAETIAAKKAEAAEAAKANAKTAAKPEDAAPLISRILLKGGAKIDADAVWEEPTRIGYRLGKIQTFVDRAAVEKVLYDITEDEPLPDLQLPNLKFTTGHRGLDQLIVHNAIRYDVNPLLIYLLMKQESGFNHRAVSRVGAQGLMQLMPETAQRLGVRNINDPVENVDAGTRYLKSLIQLFNGDVNLALAGYNAGENAVIRYGYRVPPYRETQNYVYSINIAYRRAVAQGNAPAPAELQAQLQKQKQSGVQRRATTASR
jgi:soluble lytic murein transglycosylase-like protein